MSSRTINVSLTRLDIEDLMTAIDISNNEGVLSEDREKELYDILAAALELYDSD